MRSVFATLLEGYCGIPPSLGSHRTFNVGYTTQQGLFKIYYLLSSGAVFALSLSDGVDQGDGRGGLYFFLRLCITFKKPTTKLQNNNIHFIIFHLGATHFGKGGR